MTDYVWPADIVPYGQSFYLQAHTGGTESPFSKLTKTYGLSAPRWISRISLRAPESEDRWGESAVSDWGERVEAFLAKVRGRENRVLLWDFRREGQVGSFANQAIAAGNTAVAINGAGIGDIRVGSYVSGDGRPHLVTDVMAGGVSPAGVTIKVEPAFQSAVAAGGLTFIKSAGFFKLTSDDAGQNYGEVGQLTSYDLEFVEDVTDTSISLYDTFSDPAGTKMRDRDIQWRSIYGYGPIPAKWEVFSGDWEAQGDGYARPISTSSDASNLLRGCILTHCGTAGDRTLTAVINADIAHRPGAIVATTGRYFVGFRIHNTGTALQIVQGDMHAGAPAYGSAANSFTVVNSAALTGWVNFEDAEFVAELTGVGTGTVTLTVTHVGLGISVSGTITVAIGPYAGLWSVSSSSKFRSVKVEPVTQSYFGIGNGVNLLDHRIIEFAGDPEAMDLVDRDGDGLPDLAYVVSTNGNRRVAGIYTADQLIPDHWVTTPIDVNSSTSSTARWKGVEGICFLPISSYRYAYVNDADDLKQYIVDLENPGSRLLLSSYVWAQDCRVLTISGYTCVVSAHQGAVGGGTGIAGGGIVGYRYLGGDPMSLASWDEFTIVRRKGAWGFQKTDFGLVDIADGNGAINLFYSARDSNNTDVTAPGIYSVALGADPFNTEWTETARYLPGDGQDTFVFDFGDFSGDGNNLDILFANYTGTGTARYLRKSTGWGVVAMATLGLAASNKIVNIGKMPTRGTGTRDGAWALIDGQGFYHIYWTGSWATTVFAGAAYSHGSNSPSTPLYERPGGDASLLIGNSSGATIVESRFKAA